MHGLAHTLSLIPANFFPMNFISYFIFPLLVKTVGFAGDGSFGFGGSGFGFESARAGVGIGRP